MVKMRDNFTYGTNKNINILTGMSILLLLCFIGLSIIVSPSVVAGEVEENIMVNLNQGDDNDGIQALGIEVDEIKGNKMVELRKLGNKFNWGFGFRSEDKTVIIYGDKNEVQLNINKAKYNDQELSEPPIIKDGRTYISFEVLKRLLGDLENMEPELLATLNTDKVIVNRGKKIKALIELYNISDNNVRINYPSGQLYDLYLVHENAEVWRWSDDRFFTMALRYKDLKPGDKLHYEEEITFDKDYKEGGYILGGKIATRTPISLPELEIEVK